MLDYRLYGEGRRSSSTNRSPINRPGYKKNDIAYVIHKPTLFQRVIIMFSSLYT